MEKKPNMFRKYFFKKLNMKNSSGHDHHHNNTHLYHGSTLFSWLLKLKTKSSLYPSSSSVPPSSSFSSSSSSSSSSSRLRWKKGFSLYLWFLDSILFRIASFVESIVLVSSLAFFFLCCGCHF
ncbi:hypothetical protein Leryth_018702 [Lithospermum erythrorhizon]|nr:hypothetical protein Leryth_018702 [Lithospermum erythrorhizon]